MASFHSFDLGKLFVTMLDDNVPAAVVDVFCFFIFKETAVGDVDASNCLFNDFIVRCCCCNGFGLLMIFFLLIMALVTLTLYGVFTLVAAALARRSARTGFIFAVPFVGGGLLGVAVLFSMLLLVTGALVEGIVNITLDLRTGGNGVHCPFSTAVVPFNFGLFEDIKATRGSDDVGNFSIDLLRPKGAGVTPLFTDLVVGDDFVRDIGFRVSVLVVLVFLSGGDDLAFTIVGDETLGRIWLRVTILPVDVVFVVIVAVLGDDNDVRDGVLAFFGEGVLLPLGVTLDCSRAFLFCCCCCNIFFVGAGPPRRFAVFPSVTMCFFVVWIPLDFLDVGDTTISGFTDDVAVVGNSCIFGESIEIIS